MAIGKRNTAIPGIAIFGMAIFGNVRYVGGIGWSERECKESVYVTPDVLDSTNKTIAESTTRWSEHVVGNINVSYCENHNE